MQEINKDHALDVRRYLLDLQDNIIAMIYKYDNSKFIKDEWSRDEGGGGLTCNLQN